jgi:hypothetical protein
MPYSAKPSKRHQKELGLFKEFKVKPKFRNLTAAQFFDKLENNPMC